MYRIHIEVKNGKSSTYFYRNELNSLGLRWSKRQKKWLGITENMNMALKVKHFAKEKHLICLVYDEKHTRAINYRYNFFKKNEPMFGSKYICAYCFKPISKENATVDHIIPVKKAQANKLANRLMDRLHIQDINEEKNLCACCQSCNASKGSKAGLWIIRGFLGKKKWFIILIYMSILLFILILILAISFVYQKGGIIYE